jgi:methoxymalonate biosynthesis acyl carrier protein
MSTSTERAADPAAITANLVEFVAGRTRKTVAADVDLFGSGLVSSLFAMQLVAHVESTFGVTVQGPDLTLTNFRTIGAITALVLRLRGNSGG